MNHWDVLRDELSRAEVDKVMVLSFKNSAHRWPDGEVEDFIQQDVVRCIHHANTVLLMLAIL